MKSHSLPTRLLGVALLIGLGAASVEAATRIYRTVDEDGNVVFTDVPPRDAEQEAAVDVNAPNSFTPPPVERETRSVSEWLGNDADAPADPGEEAAPLSYQSLRVAAPANDEGIRENAGNVTVTAAIEPQLATGHAIQVYLDGQLRQSGHATSFQLVNVDRGTHSLQLRVVDASGNTVIASEPSVFHLQRRSVILQPANRRASN